MLCIISLLFLIFILALTIHFLNLTSDSKKKTISLKILKPLLIILSFIALPLLVLFSGINYLENIVAIKEPEEIITNSYELVSCADNSSIKGSIKGDIFYVQGNLGVESEYKFYYKMNDGGIKQKSIDADNTTIYFISSQEVPKFIEKSRDFYHINYNYDSPKKAKYHSEIIYELHIPENSIKNVFKLDLE